MTTRPGKHDDELISASLTGDLSEAEQSELDRHLADCARCRDTLAAFSEERRLISGMRHVSPPRDLGARVRAGIDRGSSGSLPWWRRRSTIIGMGASLATVATAILAVLVIGNLQRGLEVGQLSQTPTPSSSQSSISVEPSVSGEPTAEPQPTATINPQAFLRPGELGYFSMTGAPQEPLRLTFIKDSTGESVAAEAPSGPPMVAAISPDGEWVGYITDGTYTGINQVWALHLTDGTNVQLGCSLPNPFTDRLVWSTDSRYLAYTLAAVDAESHARMGCGDVEPGPARSTDAWIFQTDTGEHYPLTTSGDAFAADMAGVDLEGGTNLLISHGAEQPWSEYVRLPEPLSPEAEPVRMDGAFMPLISPLGIESVAYWTGKMAQGEDGSWRFSQGGMPVVGSFAANPPDGKLLFTDLSTAGGAGFENGHVAWGQDGDLIAFWGGEWTAAPQGDDYPSVLGVYAGRLTDGGLTMASRLDLPVDADVSKIVSIAFQPDGVRAVVSLGDKTLGIGDPVSANLFLVPIGGGEAVPVGGAIDPPPWDGPAVYGEQPRALGP